MELKLTPFKEIELKKQYELIKFNELGINICMLNETTKTNKIPSGNFYKFGLILDNKYYWFFAGNAVADNRNKMREIYSALLQVNKKGTLFVYKVKKR